MTETIPDHKPERVYADLLPCPFCGGEGSIGNGQDGAFAHCVDCLASTNILCPHNLSKDEAIAAWNRRAEPQQPEAEAGGVTQAVCNKCGFVGVPDDYGFHHRPKDGVMCDYTALARPSQPDILAENARLREALERCAQIVERNLYRQHEKVEDVPKIARAALRKLDPAFLQPASDGTDLK